MLLLDDTEASSSSFLLDDDFFESPDPPELDFAAFSSLRFLTSADFASGLKAFHASSDNRPFDCFLNAPS